MAISTPNTQSGCTDDPNPQLPLIPESKLVSNVTAKREKKGGERERTTERMQAVGCEVDHCLTILAAIMVGERCVTILGTWPHFSFIFHLSFSFLDRYVLIGSPDPAFLSGTPLFPCFGRLYCSLL